MAEAPESACARGRPLAGGLVVSACMAAFGFLVHSPFPGPALAAAALGAVAIVIGLALRRSGDRGAPLGIGRPSTRTAVWSAIAIAIGAALGVAYRNWLGNPLLPAGVSRFAPIALAIGILEELIYRGFVQGRFGPLGAPAAIVLASAAHTLYKCALFAYPALAGNVNLGWLAGLTFLGGLAFGLMRHAGRHIAPPAVAHAVFDLVVYGDRADAPWWVWS